MTLRVVLYAVLLTLVMLMHPRSTAHAFSVRTWSEQIPFPQPQQHTGGHQPTGTLKLPASDSVTTFVTATATGISTMMVLLQPSIAMASVEVEVAELPPPWIPVVFGIGLVVGVGLLTGSLGDVIEQESQLGLQSGARAKKEIERSRSSYFKKK